jgi:hypothetical protein
MQGEAFMTCADAKEIMAAVWKGERPPGFDQHIENCTECSMELAALGGLWERLADMPVPEPSEALHARWHATLATLLPAPKPSFWNRPVWQAGIAMACLAAGVLIGAYLPRRNSGEIAKLREEIAGTRAMVALSLLQQQSATERLRGVDYTGRMPIMEPRVVSALIQAVSHDANVNVRLGAIDALTRVAAQPAVVDSLSRSLPRQDSPMVQAALIDYLVDAHDRRAVGALRQMASRPDLNPAVLDRAHFALQQLSQ